MKKELKPRILQNRPKNIKDANIKPPNCNATRRMKKPRCTFDPSHIKMILYLIQGYKNADIKGKSDPNV